MLQDKSQTGEMEISTKLEHQKILWAMPENQKLSDLGKDLILKVMEIFMLLVSELDLYIGLVKIYINIYSKYLNY